MNDDGFPDDGLVHRVTITAEIPAGPGIEIVAAELLLEVVQRFEYQGITPETLRLDINTRLRT
ncbi:hypothetical protein BH23ACT1_BH23ACT1_07540 [soil metagenome]|jgi:hypothetical protein